MAEEKNGGDNYSEIIGDARGVGKHDAIVVGYHVFFLEHDIWLDEHFKGMGAMWLDEIVLSVFLFEYSVDSWIQLLCWREMYSQAVIHVIAFTSYESKQYSLAIIKILLMEEIRLSSWGW